MSPLLQFLTSSVLFLALLCSNVAASEKPTFIADEYPPFNYLNHRGEVVGIAVDVLERVMSEIDNAFSKDDISLMPWARGYRLLQDNTNATLFTMIKTEDREKLFRFVGPISASNLVVISKKTDLQINSLDDLADHSVAVVRDGLGDQLLKKISTQRIACIRLLSPEQVIKLLVKDRVDAIIVDESIARFQLRQFAEDQQQYRVIYSVNHSGTYFAFNKNVDSDYFTRFEAAFAKLKSNGVVDQIYQNHLGNL